MTTRQVLLGRFLLHLGLFLRHLDLLHLELDRLASQVGLQRLDLANQRVH